MEGKRITTLMAIMCLVILSHSVNSATADCDCCYSDLAKACCFACIAASSSDAVCKNTCCFPCFLGNSDVTKKDVMGFLAEMKEGEA
ncbi:unnamed protein product [Urochloa humidicola]